MATDEAIFELKARVILNRQTSRDYFDLWYFLEHKGKTVNDILRVMRDANPHYTVDAHLLRLSSPKIGSADPLWQTSLPDAPQNLQELTHRLGAFVDAYRRQLAMNAALQAQRGCGLER